MKTFKLRLPDALVADIEAEAKARRISKSDVICERLEAPRRPPTTGSVPFIEDLAGSVKGLPPDLSSRKKHYLRVTGYGKSRADRPRHSHHKD